MYGSTDEPLFLAVGVAKLIDYSVGHTTMMLEVVDDSEKLTATILRSGQGRRSWFLTEDGLYEVLMQSRKPIAKQFKSVVKHILKELRRGRCDITGWFEHLDLLADVLEFEQYYDLEKGDYIDGYWEGKGGEL